MARSKLAVASAHLQREGSQFRPSLSLVVGRSCDEIRRHHRSRPPPAVTPHAANGDAACSQRPSTRCGVRQRRSSAASSAMDAGRVRRSRVNSARYKRQRPCQPVDSARSTARTARVGVQQLRGAPDARSIRRWERQPAAQQFIQHRTQRKTSARTSHARLLVRTLPNGARICSGAMYGKRPAGHFGHCCT